MQDLKKIKRKGEDPSISSHHSRPKLRGGPLRSDPPVNVHLISHGACRVKCPGGRDETIDTREGVALNPCLGRHGGEWGGQGAAHARVKVEDMVVEDAVYGGGHRCSPWGCGPPDQAVKGTSTRQCAGHATIHDGTHVQGSDGVGNTGEGVPRHHTRSIHGGGNLGPRARRASSLVRQCSSQVQGVQVI